MTPSSPIPLEVQFPFLSEETGKRRVRQLLTPEQTAVLQKILARTHFPSTKVREAVAKELGITPRKVQVWFQNVRQKEKKRTLMAAQDLVKMHRNGSDSASSSPTEPFFFQARGAAAAPPPHEQHEAAHAHSHAHPHAQDWHRIRPVQSDPALFAQQAHALGADGRVLPAATRLPFPGMDHRPMRSLSLCGPNAGATASASAAAGTTGPPQSLPLRRPVSLSMGMMRARPPPSLSSSYACSPSPTHTTTTTTDGSVYSQGTWSPGPGYFSSSYSPVHHRHQQQQHAQPYDAPVPRRLGHSISQDQLTRARPYPAPPSRMHFPGTGSPQQLTPNTRQRRSATLSGGGDAFPFPPAYGPARPRLQGAPQLSPIESSLIMSPLEAAGAEAARDGRWEHVPLPHHVHAQAMHHHYYQQHPQHPQYGHQHQHQHHAGTRSLPAICLPLPPARSNGAGARRGSLDSPSNGTGRTPNTSMVRQYSASASAPYTPARPAAAHGLAMPYAELLPVPSFGTMPARRGGAAAAAGAAPQRRRRAASLLSPPAAGATSEFGVGAGDAESSDDDEEDEDARHTKMARRQLSGEEQEELHKENAAGRQQSEAPADLDVDVDGGDMSTDEGQGAAMQRRSPALETQDTSSVTASSDIEADADADASSDAGAEAGADPGAMMRSLESGRPVHLAAVRAHSHHHAHGAHLAFPHSRDAAHTPTPTPASRKSYFPSLLLSENAREHDAKTGANANGSGTVSPGGHSIAALSKRLLCMKTLDSGEEEEEGEERQRAGEVETEADEDSRMSPCSPTGTPRLRERQSFTPGARHEHGGGGGGSSSNSGSRHHHQHYQPQQHSPHQNPHERITLPPIKLRFPTSPKTRGARAGASASLDCAPAPKSSASTVGTGTRSLDWWGFRPSSPAVGAHEEPSLDRNMDAGLHRLPSISELSLPGAISASGSVGRGRVDWTRAGEAGSEDEVEARGDGVPRGPGLGLHEQRPDTPRAGGAAGRMMEHAIAMR